MCYKIIKGTVDKQGYFFNTKVNTLILGILKTDMKEFAFKMYEFWLFWTFNYLVIWGY